MGQEVLDAFWKSNDRIYNENTLLYHRLARTCGLPDCAFWLLYTLRSEEAPLTQTQLSEQLSLPKQTVNSALKKLVEAIEEDDSYYEEEALRRGVSVEQLKSMKKLERDNESMRRALEDQQRRENAERVYAGWVKQAEELKTIYPAFDLQEECRNEQFVGLLQNNVDVRTAYEVIHRDEILGGAMQYTAEQV